MLLTMQSAFAITVNKNLWPVWLPNNALSTEEISHKDWQTFLDNTVTTNNEGINLVNYGSISEKDLNLLNHYINYLSIIHIEHYNRKEQLAYWINLYNALIIKTIISYYPIDSIDEINISPGLFSIGPWGARVAQINHESLSLDDIQNRIIRPIWNDPRSHYALCNGSIGAPNLSKSAYLGNLIDSQLNEAAINYVNSLRGAQIIEGRLFVSKVYEWFHEDFGGGKKNTILHFKQYAKEPLKSQLKHINTIDGYVYNWHLNSVVPK